MRQRGPNPVVIDMIAKGVPVTEENYLRAAGHATTTRPLPEELQAEVRQALQQYREFLERKELAANDSGPASVRVKDTDEMMAAHAERDSLDDLQMQFELDNPRPSLKGKAKRADATPSPDLDPMRPAIDALEEFYKSTAHNPKKTPE